MSRSEIKIELLLDATKLLALQKAPSFSYKISKTKIHLPKILIFRI